MPPEQKPAVTREVESETSEVSGKFIGYLFVFLILCFLLYIIPELLIFKQHGFTPVEHLVDTGPHPSLGDVLASLWTDRAQLMNPMNNPLVRFFLVTMIVGVVFDKVKQYSPVSGEVPDRNAQ